MNKRFIMELISGVQSSNRWSEYSSIIHERNVNWSDEFNSHSDLLCCQGDDL